MKAHLPLPRHTHTRHIRINPSRCEACGECVEACPRGVLGLVSFFSHCHVHVDHAEFCKGCKKCVRACQRGAISSISPIKADQPASAPA